MNELFMKIYKILDKKFEPEWDIYRISGKLLDMKTQYFIYDKEKRADNYTFALAVESVVYIDYRDTYAIEMSFHHSEHNNEGNHEAITFIEYIPSWAIETTPEEQAFNRWVDHYDVMMNRWKAEYR